MGKEGMVVDADVTTGVFEGKRRAMSTSTLCSFHTGLRCDVALRERAGDVE
jgi:hypothetical protein